MKKKLLLIVALPVFLWQSAQCTIVIVENAIEKPLKCKFICPFKDTESRPITINPGQSRLFNVDSSARKFLVSRADLTSYKRNYYYSDINIVSGFYNYIKVTSAPDKDPVRYQIELRSPGNYIYTGDLFTSQYMMYTGIDVTKVYEVKSHPIVPIETTTDKSLKLPIRIEKQHLYEFDEQGICSKTTDSKTDAVAYLPFARPTCKLNDKQVLPMYILECARQQVDDLPEAAKNYIWRRLTNTSIKAGSMRLYEALILSHVDVYLTVTTYTMPARKAGPDERYPCDFELDFSGFGALSDRKKSNIEFFVCNPNYGQVFSHIRGSHNLRGRNDLAEHMVSSFYAVAYTPGHLLVSLILLVPNGLENDFNSALTRSRDITDALCVVTESYKKKKFAEALVENEYTGGCMIISEDSNILPMRELKSLLTGIFELQRMILQTEVTSFNFYPLKKDRSSGSPSLTEKFDLCDGSFISPVDISQSPIVFKDKTEKPFVMTELTLGSETQAADYIIRGLDDTGNSDEISYTTSKKQDGVFSLSLRNIKKYGGYMIGAKGSTPHIIKTLKFKKIQSMSNFSN